MTTFQEEFPSLKGRVPTYVKQHCLDKQIVRAVLDKAFEDGVMDCSELKKRLGL